MTSTWCIERPRKRFRRSSFTQFLHRTPSAQQTEHLHRIAGFWHPPCLMNAPATSPVIQRGAWSPRTISVAQPSHGSHSRRLPPTSGFPLVFPMHSFFFLYSTIFGLMDRVLGLSCGKICPNVLKCLNQGFSGALKPCQPDSPSATNHTSRCGVLQPVEHLPVKLLLQKLGSSPM
ncbi:hypothetical protein GWK47_016637 [Chionoecetes opilio]|uniref:Uncharacterized protein n=1 Tax=Chionoecetes opilio TaxID=41210 RepID=A0A8J4XUE3_CHIOP|nr:hypothetical protein GWK47_016637 [Chionoecetes opilio]